MDNILELIGTTKTQDATGVWRETPLPRAVYCQEHSITRSEFYDAGRNGLNPELMLTVFAGDYFGERTCKYKGQKYAIYRTYRGQDADYIELYIQREGGTNGKG